jgi:predicted nucleic acid-binding protein
MVVIADTTPINYLVLIGEQELLPTLFGQIIIPEAVFRELHAAVTPQPVQQGLAKISPLPMLGSAPELIGARADQGHLILV